MKELDTASMEIGKIMYEEAAKKAQTGPAGATGAQDGGTKGGDDVVDAEYKVKE
jgi:hypothetical protein